MDNLLDRRMAAAARVQHRRARQVLLVARSATTVIGVKVPEPVASHVGAEKVPLRTFFDTHILSYPVDDTGFKIASHLVVLWARIGKIGHMRRKSER